MITRPVLRYPGGKYQLAPWIVQHFPSHQVYVELYGGAGSVLMRKPRAMGEIYNDIDGDVLNVFRVLRDRGHAAELMRLLQLTPYSFTEYKGAYEFSEDPVERARRTIFRLFAGIGSDSVFENNGFRGMKNNRGRTCAPEWSRYPLAVQAFVERLQGVVIEERPATNLIKVYRGSGHLLYADPPYLKSTRTSESVRYTNEMSIDDHVELAGALRKTVEKNGTMVVVSGYPSELYEELYQGWRRVEHTGKLQTGRKSVECLWLSPNIRTFMF